MQWVVIAIVLLLATYFIIFRQGRFDFWKVAGKHADDAFEMFQQQDCWHVFVEKPMGGYRGELPDGEWDGPFKLAIPKLGNRLITVFGKVPDYEDAQQQFIDKLKSKPH